MASWCSRKFTCDTCDDCHSDNCDKSDDECVCTVLNSILFAEIHHNECVFLLCVVAALLADESALSQQGCGDQMTEPFFQTSFQGLDECNGNVRCVVLVLVCVLLMFVNTMPLLKSRKKRQHQRNYW